MLKVRVVAAVARAKVLAVAPMTGADGLATLLVAQPAKAAMRM
jgi:hypothetical protein